MSIVFDKIKNEIIDERCPENKIFSGGKISVSYTLLSDDITKGEKPPQTPYKDRNDDFEYLNDAFFANETQTNLVIKEYKNGLLFEMESDREDISSFGVNLPFNFIGKLNSGGWQNQFLFNSPYISNNGKIIYSYLTNPNGNNLVVAILSEADGWKMDYSSFSFGHYFINLKLLANFDKAYKTKRKENQLKFLILPVSDFKDCLSKLSEAYDVPFLDYNFSGGKIGDDIFLDDFGSPDAIIEVYDEKETSIDFSSTYRLKNEGETELIPVKNGKRGAGVSIYAYDDIKNLYKKSMDSVDLDVIKNNTDSNLCEHQCWASAMMRFLLKYPEMLTIEEKDIYEKKLKSLLDVITESDKSKATPRITILNKPHEDFLAYNIFKSRRVQELFFGITILLDAYRYFHDEKYLIYAKGATECLISYYQKEDGRIEIDWGDNKEDYTTVCSPMIPLCDMANFFKGKDKEASERYFNSAKKMARYLYNRGMKFPTEGEASKKAEEEMEDGSISCTALSLLYYCKNVEMKQEYIEKAKEILDIHESWVIKTPLCQMKNSTLRWWETQWEGDADGPAICAGHAWTIWRAEADYLYYTLSGDYKYFEKAKNGFMTNLSKIDKNGKSYAIYNPDRINGGGFTNRAENVKFEVAPRFAKREDCGMSRYVWIRLASILE